MNKVRTLILTECAECGEECSIVKVNNQLDYHRHDEQTIRGIDCTIVSSETMVAYKCYCRNCDRVYEHKDINLN